MNDYIEGKKIGMCCACGDQMSSSRTILADDGFEYCPRCAEMLDIEESEE